MDKVVSHSQHRHGPGIRSAPFAYCGVILAVLVAGTVLLAGCGGRSQTATTLPSRATTASTPAATPTPPAFSPFHEWRAAYIDSDDQLHAVTLDGKNAAAGPYLSPIQDGMAWTSAGFSPDGHYLAFQVPSLTILDATRRNARTPLDPTLLAWAMAWSPQGDTLAVYTGPGTSSYVIIDAVTGRTRHVPGISTDYDTPGSVAELIGWIDATHLAVTLVPGGPYYTAPNDPRSPRYPLTTTLASLDITTGAVRPIVTITFSTPPPGGSRFLLSPDGTKALFYTWQSQTQLVDVIDIATGQVTPLPTIAAQIAKSSQWMASFAWRPASDTIAASLPYPSAMEAVLLDVRRDTVTHLNLSNGQWWVEGWAPDAKTLILSSDWGRSADTYMNPHDVSALTFGTNGQTSFVVLTHDAYLAPFVGFVRTA
ncbi:MAG: hypothetical protein ACXVDF_10705 [Ktedonobacterales bacterium]